MTEVLSPHELFISIHDIAIMAHGLELSDNKCQRAPADVLKEVIDIPTGFRVGGIRAERKIFAVTFYFWNKRIENEF
jgi:hypothetical protein